MEVTVISDEARRVPGRVDGDAVLVAYEAVRDLLGWEVKPEGMCRDGVCVPYRDADPRSGDLVDLAVAAGVVRRPVVADPVAAIVAVAAVAATDGMAAPLADGIAPDFELADLDGNAHRLSDLDGHKRVLVTFASWCGCRYDLPGWQALQDELADDGLRVVAVAFDDDPEAVAPFTKDISLPVLLDDRHLLSELYAISNVPTSVWIDEEGRIARPNTLAFATDTFKDFTGVASGPNLDALRRWVRTGEVEAVDADTAGEPVPPLSEDEILARLHFRVGAEALRAGHEDRGRWHLEHASELAPYDWTVRRAAMPLLGENPFGQHFLDLYDEWQEHGAPQHGLPALVED